MCACVCVLGEKDFEGDRGCRRAARVLIDDV
jgi:hypothetical protein